MLMMFLFVNVLVFLFLAGLYRLKKEDREMAVAYATLIINGKKSFADVPVNIKEQVKQVLIDLDCGYLAD